MRPLQISRPLLESVIGTVIGCSADRHECVVYVTASVDDKSLAVGFIHPSHSGTPVSTEVTGQGLDEVWDELLHRGERIVLQVHSHPGSAFHSGTDDHWPVVHRVGFMSLVLPNFGRSGMTGAHLAVYDGNGKWTDLPPKKREEGLMIVDG